MVWGEAGSSLHPILSYQKGPFCGAWGESLAGVGGWGRSFDMGWQSPGPPSLHLLSMHQQLTSAPSSFCFPSCYKAFFFSLQAHHSSNTNILHASLLPRLFPPLLCLAEHLQPSPACPRASTHQQDLQGSATPHLSSIEVVSHLTSDLRPTVLLSSTQARVTMQKTTCLKKDMKFPAATSNHARQSWLQGAF